MTASERDRERPAERDFEKAAEIEESCRSDVERLMRTARALAAERASIPESVLTRPMKDVLAKCGGISKEIPADVSCRDQHVFMAAINWYREQAIADLERWQKEGGG